MRKGGTGTGGLGKATRRRSHEFSRFGLCSFGSEVSTYTFVQAISSITGSRTPYLHACTL